MLRLFRPSPDEISMKWRLRVRGDKNRLEKRLKVMENEEIKLTDEIKKNARRGNTSDMRLQVHRIIRMRKAKTRLYANIGQLDSLHDMISEQVNMAKTAKTFTASAKIAKKLNKLIKIKDISKSMRELGAEMTKAGLITEMIEDTLSSLEDDVDDEVDDQVDCILFEITDGAMGKLKTAETEENRDEQLELMEKRIEMLKH